MDGGGKFYTGRMPDDDFDWDEDVADCEHHAEGCDICFPDLYDAPAVVVEGQE